MQPIYILEPLSTGASEIPIPANGRAKVGREASNDFPFPHDLQMSSAHFEIFAEPGGCRIHDLGSANGLFLNAKRVNSAIVVEGDEVQAGESRWRLAVHGDDVPSSGTVSAGASMSVETSPCAPPLTTPPARAVDEQPDRQVFDSELVLTACDGSSRRLAGSQNLSIGRTSAAQWVFEDDEQMSSYHMDLSQQAGVWKVTDQASSNGTFVNGARVTEAQLFSGDEIRGGRTQFKVSILKRTPEQPTPLPVGLPESTGPAQAETGLDTVSPHPVHALAGDHAAQQTPRSGDQQTTPASLRRLSDGREFNLLPNQLVSLGRSPESQISLASDFEVSTQHATLVFDGSCIQLCDVGSTNGTFVGGQRITAAELAHGDRLRVGKTEFVVCLPQTDPMWPDAPPSVPPSVSPLQHLAPPSDSEPSPKWPDAPPSVPPSVSPPQHLAPPSDSDSIPMWPDAPPSVPPSVSPPQHLAPPSDSEPSPMWPDAPPSVPPSASPPQQLAPPSDSDSSPMWPDAPPSVPPSVSPPQHTPADGDADSPPESQNQLAEHTLPCEPNRIDSESHPIDLKDRSYAGQAAALEALACHSGLFVYLGEAATLQPVDVCLSLLQATSGWVLNGSEIENWIQAASQGLSGQPREWLNPAHADDASWMLPFLDSWGSGNTWLVLSHVDLDEGLLSLRNLRQSSEGCQPLLASLTPTSLADFLTGQDRSVVEPFFAPFDAILLEVGLGQRWAVVGRLELEEILKSSNL